MPQSPWINIKKKNFVLLQTQMGWYGVGSEQDPYIIDTVSGLSPFLKFINISDYIIITDLTISKISLVKCRNVIIQGCNIQYLTLHSCQEVTVRENTLRKFEIMYGGNNLITKNKITRNALFQAKEHSMETLIQRIMLLVIGIMIFAAYYLFTNPSFLQYTPWYIYFPIGVAVLMLFLYLQMVFKRLRSRRLPPDRFVENNITDERDMLSQYFKGRP